MSFMNMIVELAERDFDPEPSRDDVTHYHSPDRQITVSIYRQRAVNDDLVVRRATGGEVVRIRRDTDAVEALALLRATLDAVTTKTAQPQDDQPTTHTGAAFNPRQLGYTWSDLRERPIAELNVGDVMVKLDAFEAYRTGEDGWLAGAMTWTPSGSAWRITARSDDTYSVTRTDGRRAQTFTAATGMKVITVDQPGL